MNDIESVDGADSVDEPAPSTPAVAQPPPHTFLGSVRAVALDLIGIWIFISFFRLFIAENYRIPTSSMTPTLVGGTIAHLDINDDDRLDYVLVRDGQRYEVFTNTGDGYTPSRQPMLSTDIRQQVTEKARERHDHILVSKFHYWLRPPSRGDIAVFRPPASQFRREAPIYVKRIVGLPNENIAIRNGRLWADGEPVREPASFLGRYYKSVSSGRSFRPLDLTGDEYLFFGDNTLNSSDGREWGGVPSGNIKGKVFFRYWPPRFFGPVR